jgi:hypothetical protein
MLNEPKVKNMDEKIINVPLKLEDTGEMYTWPVLESEYKALMDKAEKSFGQRPREISFILRLDKVEETAKRIVNGGT